MGTDIFNRMKDTKLWLKVFILGLRTSLVILIAFIIEDYIDENKRTYVYKDLFIKVFMKFIIIFFSATLVFALSYIVFGSDV